jgi:hypothetical protein
MKKLIFVSRVCYSFSHILIWCQDPNPLQGLSFPLGFGLFSSRGRFDSVREVSLAVRAQFLVRRLAPPQRAVCPLVLPLGSVLGWFFVRIFAAVARNFVYWLDLRFYRHRFHGSCSGFSFGHRSRLLHAGLVFSPRLDFSPRQEQLRRLASFTFPS